MGVTSGGRRTSLSMSCRGTEAATVGGGAAAVVAVGGGGAKVLESALMDVLVLVEEQRMGSETICCFEAPFCCSRLWKHHASITLRLLKFSSPLSLSSNIRVACFVRELTKQRGFDETAQPRPAAIMQARVLNLSITCNPHCTVLLLIDSSQLSDRTLFLACTSAVAAEFARARFARQKSEGGACACVCLECWSTFDHKDRCTGSVLTSTSNDEQQPAGFILGPLFCSPLQISNRDLCVLTAHLSPLNHPPVPPNVLTSPAHVFEPPLHGAACLLLLCCCFHAAWPSGIAFSLLQKRCV